jgi:hypothetical protein
MIDTEFCYVGFTVYSALLTDLILMFVISIKINYLQFIMKKRKVQYKYNLDQLISGLIKSLFAG